VARPLQPWAGVRAYQLLIVAGAVAVELIGCDTSLLTGSDCTESVDKTIDLDNPLPPVQLKIESCRVDVDACGALCTRVMADNNLGGGINGGGPSPGLGDQFPGAPSDTFVPYTKCAVTFEGSTTHVEVAYDQWNGGENCPVFDNAGGGMP
jgi:hypothetical protein